MSTNSSSSPGRHRGLDASAPTGPVDPSPGPVDSHFTTRAAHLGGRHDGMPPVASELGLMRRSGATPHRGWRKLLHRLTRGLVNPGESSARVNEQALVERINAPVRGSYSIAVLSLKGGVGKTTTAVCLGTTFASVRGDRVIAVDANPDFGTLAQRGPNQTRSTVRDLMADGELMRYSDIRRHTSQNADRLEFVASERDPAVSESFSERDYRAVHDILDRFYNIILTDCGTGLTHSAMRGVLDTADALVVVASPAIDSARSALATLDWLHFHGYAELVAQATVVLSSARPGGVPIDLDQLSRHFESRVRSVFAVPYDEHLAEGGEIVLSAMRDKTRRQYMNVAASMADSFGHKRRRAEASVPR